MNNIPGVYSLEIQQGNIINQEMIDQLRPKMTKRQVLYIMGSSMLLDVFHQKRWDYLYSTQPGGEVRRQKRLSLFFEDDKLIGVQGDFRPSTLPVIRKSNETTVEVPKRHLDNTLWGKMNRVLNDDVQPTVAEEPTASLTQNKSDESDIIEISDSKSKEMMKPAIDKLTPEIIDKATELKQDISIVPLPDNPLQEIEEILENK